MATNESVRVMVRFRPTNKSEQKKAKQTEPWATLQEKDVGINMISNQLSLYGIQEHGENNITFKKKKSKFYFDALMDEKTSQEQAFEKVAQQICNEIIQGYNGTVFVYGQSGSGKTHTMYGPEEKKDSISMDRESMGIIPRACCYIFEILNNKNHQLVEGMLSYTVECEFIEIYNEKLKDLLDLSHKPQIREQCIDYHKDVKKREWRVITTNVKRLEVQNFEQVLIAIREASKRRTVAGTNLNATSSRSHMVMKLIVKIVTAEGVRTGVGNFSDLAGSEKVKKTGAVGQQLVEAKSILLSLSTLSRVIEAAVENKLPPFKDSKLTFMLKDSLGGNCKTALLICCSPHVFNRDETVRSLRFGVQCRKIQNKAKINAVRTKAQLIQENEELKSTIERLKNSTHEFIMVDNKKTIEKEKEKHLLRINELEKANGKLSHQIQELAQEKTANDVVFEKLNNDFAELTLKTDQISLDLTEKEAKMQGFESTKQRLTAQTNELSLTIKKINQSNNSLNVENGRLQERNGEQIFEMNKLKKECKLIKANHIELQNKWRTELDDNKSQFVVSNQTIDSLQLQIKQSNQMNDMNERELVGTQNKLKAKQNTIHQLQDENRRINDDLSQEKVNNVAICSEKQQLKIQIKQLLSQLNQEKMKTNKADLELQKERNRQFNEFEEQQSKINELEFDIELKANELQSKNNIIEEIKKEHEQQVSDLKFEMGALTNLNQQLQEENKTATDVVDVHMDQLSHHKKKISTVEADNMIIQMQLKQLQTHYHKVVQQQIESDYKWAAKLQTDETKQFIDKQRERQRAKAKTYNYQYSGDESEELLGAADMHMTAGGDMESVMVKKFKQDFQDEKNSSDESQEDDNDMKAQQNAMFGDMITQKMRKRRNEKGNTNKKEMMQLYKKKQRELLELQAQIDRDNNMAWNMYKDQRDLHHRDKKRKEAESREREKRYRDKYYISADKISVTEGNEDDYINYKKKKKAKRKIKSSVDDEDNQQYLDPNDGTGLLIIDSDNAEY